METTTNSDDDGGQIAAVPGLVALTHALFLIDSLLAQQRASLVTHLVLPGSTSYTSDWFNVIAPVNHTINDWHPQALLQTTAPPVASPPLFSRQFPPWC